MAVALSPASSARLRPQSAARFISFLNNITTGRNVLTGFRTLTNKAPTFPPFLHCYPGVRHLRRDSPAFNRRCFSSAIVGAISSEEAVEKAKKEFLEKPDVGTGQKVREFRKRLRIADIKGGPDEGLDRVGQTLVVKGWVRTLRVQRSITFMEVNDGSCLSNMQCVINSDAEGYDQVESGSISTGASVWVEGAIVESQGSGQKVELRVTKVITVGKSDPSFPIQKKRISREFLRTKAHLRPRTNTFGAVSRVRNALAYATHKFFQENGFVWISSPIVTASDCEGAGEQFCVTTLIPSSRDASDSLVDTIPKTDDGLIDWSQDFFGKPAFLTVSGQLNAETYASALCDVYTFGPTFRAENSNTSRHLAEFWMIEPELAFADLSDDMACATAYLKYVVRHVLDNCKEDMDFFNTWIEKGIIDRLSDVAEKNFVHLAYTEAIELLLKAKRKFEFPVKWGCDLQSEHERYVTEEAFAGCPVIITDYPKEIKAFYMRLNDDGSTVAAMDVLVPRVGELIGGSQREERLEYLEDRLDELKLNKETYWWYLDLRRFGSVPHAGFGLGFERLVQFVTGIENIRDAIPFPRTPGSAEF
ncbi:PREDICTED: asparagine--tRNA ligase, chloroplastic/mitochondrial isoform X2 [Nelumbo nucifera]|uniref:asparagine--tRNA ligase n=1 Tax=Nelumbo nucifera TaxID=4432 RepID=A0A1U7ZWR6_NELNU|nr:PREDICTED: asparagine--tRNA ligase, chloroplastic/mitochondrial isoform X2 [Nelumbo nucifera]